MKKTAEKLALFAEKVLRENWLYRYGGYGQIIDGIRRSDCYGIRKACSWDTGITSVYNKADDRNANTAHKIATVKGKIDQSIPEVRGLLVGKTVLGHVYHAGIYVGNGMVIDIYKKDLPARLGKISDGWKVYWEDTSIDYTPIAPPIPPIAKNPYKRPVKNHADNVQFSGEDARWIIWNLIRLGYKGLIATSSTIGTNSWVAIHDVQLHSLGSTGDIGKLTYSALEA